MNQKLVFIMALTLLVGMLSVTFNVQKAEASGTIYIRAGGSIDPSDAPISTVDNVTYTLTGNITSGGDGVVIEIERDNIIFDGTGYTVQGTGAAYSRGIYLEGRSNVTIKDMAIEAFECGILLSYSSNNSVVGNNITNNSHYGVWLDSSSNNSIVGNVFTNDGLWVHNSYENVVEDNLVNGKPLIYLEDMSGFTIENAGQVILVQCDSIHVENLSLSCTDVGIELENTTNTKITGNNVTGNNREGIFLYYSSNNSIVGNDIANNEAGILLSSSLNNTIVGNNITNNDEGIDLSSLYYTYGSSLYNSIVGNNITDNGVGIYLGDSSNNNTVSENNITNNTRYGINLLWALNNSISENNIANNSKGIYLVYSSNNSISGNIITADNYNGILLEYSSNNSIVGNNVTSNVCGICLYYSSCDNLLRDNVMASNSYNFGVVSYSPSDFVNDVDVSNTVDGKAIYYWIGQRDAVVPLDAGFVALVNCSNIRVENLALAKNQQGILLAYVFNSTMTQNNVTNNGCGVWLYSSSNISIFDNSITDNSDYGIELDHSYNTSVSSNNITTNGNKGIVLDDSSNVSISGNNITANHYEGISLYNSFNDRISGNNIVDNMNGIYLYNSSNGSIFDNNLMNNKCGVIIQSSNACTFYHNNFINNGVPPFFVEQVWSFGSVNVWDDDYPSGGNYWSDYDGTDANHDGIGDTAYIIDANNTDRYPLITPYIIPEFPSFLVLPIFMIATLLAVIAFRRKQADRR